MMLLQLQQPIAAGVETGLMFKKFGTGKIHLSHAYHALKLIAIDDLLTCPGIPNEVSYSGSLRAVKRCEF